MFQFLQHQQNKEKGKTLRLFKEIVFIFSMHAPHELVTCFPYKRNYDYYVEKSKIRDSKKKKKK